ncbi:MAG: DUF1778 domain-containing protein [Candidatus Limnocylindrales bacterium]
MLTQGQSLKKRRTAAPAKDSRIAVRVSTEQRALLDEASRAEETTLSDFVLHAATQRAAEILADRHQFHLSPPQWAAFVGLLDRPVATKPRLAALLSEPSVFDEP